MPKNVGKIISVLNKRYDVSEWRAKPFRVLISCIISQRTKDETTGPAADRLFKAANTPQSMAKLPQRKIAKLIYPAGFYNQKSKYIKAACRYLIKQHNGRVPKTRKELMKIPGIGGKCADIILLFAFGQTVVPVDTHVARISKRLGWTRQKQAEKIRADLHELFTPKKRMVVNSLLVSFGKEICKAPRPKCYMCPIEKLCPYPNKNLKKNKNKNKRKRKGK
jgi:endonuclease-3